MCVDVQHSVDLITFQDQSKQIETLQREKELLAEDVASLQSRIDYLQNSTVDSEVATRLEAKIRDLEAKLDLAQTSNTRAEVTELATISYNNNNIVICKAHKVSSNAESEAPFQTVGAR